MQSTRGLLLNITPIIAASEAVIQEINVTIKMSSIRKYDLEIIISLISDIVNTARGLRRTQGNLIVAKSARPPPLHPGRRNDRANPKLVGETQGAADRWDKWAATHHCPPSTHCLTVCRHLGNQKWWAPRSCVFGPTTKPTA